MSRQVLTYPDLPAVLTQAVADGRYEPLDSAYTKAESDAKYLTQALGDARYSLTGHLHTGVYLPVSHEPGTDPHTQYYNQARGDARYLLPATAASTYLPLVGGTLTGNLLIGGTRAAVSAQTTGSLSRARLGQIAAGERLDLTSNIWYDGTNWVRDDVASPASMITLGGGRITMNNAAAGANPVSLGIERFVLGTNGTITLTPDANQRALITSGNVMVAMTNSSSTNNWAWNTAAIRAIQIGNHGALYDGGSYTQLVNNCYEDTGGNKQMYSGIGAGKFYMNNANFYWSSAGDQGGSGVASPQTVKMALNNVGTLTITPTTPASANALILRGRMHTGDTGINGNVTYQGQDGIVRYFSGFHPTLNDAWFYLYDNGNGAARLGIHPAAWDNFLRGNTRPDADNTFSCGQPSYRWVTVYAVAGAINTSVYEAKESFSPLDPASCAQAVLETDWVNFTYKPPEDAPANPPEDMEPEQRQRRIIEVGAAHAKAIADSAHARRQKGYVLQSPVHKTHTLFGLEDRASASPGSDLAVVACALQAALKRIATLETHILALEAQPR